MEMTPGSGAAGGNVAVIGERGDVLTGMMVSAPPGGSFTATNGVISCHGRYNATARDRAVTFTTVCNDGRQGVGTARRDSSLVSGHGTVRMDDGETGQFIFGPEASILRPKRRP